MDKIETTVRIDKEVEVEVSVYDVIHTINQMPMTAKWNIISKFINELETSLDELSDSQKQVIKKFLIKKLELFEDVELTN